MLYHRLTLRIICLIGLSAWAGSAVAQRPKVGVVLSGGGAKGIAHIGALRVLEEAGIPVDYIVGTSMGAIVGGLYAIGYSANALDSIVRRQEWSFLLSDKVYHFDLSPQERGEEERYILTLPFDKLNARTRSPLGFVSGHNIFNIFTELTIGYHGDTDFSRFPIPFRCVAADIKSRKEVVLDRGDLALAMRASMAIPGFFTPVALDTLLLIDGGIVNNFPADVARAMGAEVVIGVEVNAELMGTEKLYSMTNTLPQLINLLCRNKYKENVQLIDLIIRPDLQEYSAADFHARAVDSLLTRGERATRQQWEALMQLKERYGLDKRSDETPRESRLTHVTRFHVREILLQGVTPQQEQWLRRKISLKERSDISIQEIHRTINMLYRTKAFSSVNYRLTGGPEYDLAFTLTPHPMNYFNIGARFDSEEMGALLFHTTISNSVVRGAQVALTARLSRYPYLRASFSLENTPLRRFNFTGEIRFNDIDIYTRGKKGSNVTYRYYLGELSISNLYFRNFNFQAGLRYEFFDYNAFLFANDDVTEKVRPAGFFNYFGRVQVENLDKGYFPNKGMSLQAEFSYHTDNLFTYQDGTPFSVLTVHLQKIFSISPRLKLLPTLRGRTLIGHGSAYPYYNNMGGIMPGRLSSQQLPFWGIQRMEIFHNSLWSGQLQLRRRIQGVNYLSLTGNVAQHDDHFGDMFVQPLIWGGGIAYSRDTRLGPVDAILSLSNWTKQVNFYVNWGFYF
ncbi:MAG: patatin-like phospholipase family protein [Odoribacteraceae bacterium]|jgi:NTE family protein|nr:patatin-like phospholipase family protein [Odoribacteraceae bacterium]